MSPKSVANNKKKSTVLIATSETRDPAGKRKFRFKHFINDTLMSQLNWRHRPQHGLPFNDKYYAVGFWDLPDSVVIVFARLPENIGEKLQGRGRQTKVYKMDKKANEFEFWGTDPDPIAPEQKIEWQEAEFEIQSGVLAVFWPKTLWEPPSFNL